jgi:hypothetical protein
MQMAVVRGLPNRARLGAMKRRKPKTERKELQVRVLVTKHQKRQLLDAARRNGQGLATWLRAAGLREASRLRQR